MTPEEHALWARLKQNQLGCAFRRQQPLGFYIADFICFEKSLVIEVDGVQHLNNPNDAVRDEYLQARGFRVLRFWNAEVRDDLESVLGRIVEALAEEPPTPRPPPFRVLRAPPQGERGSKDT